MGKWAYWIQQGLAYDEARRNAMAAKNNERMKAKITVTKPEEGTWGWSEVASRINNGCKDLFYFHLGGRPCYVMWPAGRYPESGMIGVCISDKGLGDSVPHWYDPSLAGGDLQTGTFSLVPQGTKFNLELTA